MNWQQTVSDPDEVKVFMALDGQDYTWRTMSAIARQTGLSEARVSQILAKYNLNIQLHHCSLNTQQLSLLPLHNNQNDEFALNQIEHHMKSSFSKDDLLSYRFHLQDVRYMKQQ